MVLGMYARVNRVGVSRVTVRSPWLTRVLVAAAKRAAPDFCFTSIQVNKGYAGRPHVDRNNAGLSLVVALGDFTGGELWLASPQGTEPLKVKEIHKTPYTGKVT
jgi:hypothetical protein